MTRDGRPFIVIAPSGKAIHCRNHEEVERVKKWVRWLEARIQDRHVRESRDEAAPRLERYRRTPW